MTTGPAPDWYVEAGRKGGRSRSPKKLAAARQNARRGGRPRGLEVAVSPELLRPLHLTLDRATGARLAVALLSGSSARVQLTVLPWPPKRARVYADGLGPKRGGRA